MNNDDIKQLLVKYITNQATDVEEREVRYWIGLHPENELYFIELYETWQNMLYIRPNLIDDEKAYQLFSAKITHKKRRLILLKFAIAATLLLLSVSSLLLLVNYRSIPGLKKNQVVAQNGSVKKIILNDGSIVWLNAGSSLKYDDNFNKTNRTVYLEGEAFFEIGHNKKNIPFLVHSKKYTVRDIGTKFNVKAYDADPFFEITVVKGEVSVEGNSETNLSDDNHIYVKPHQVLKINYRPNKIDNDNNPKETTRTAISYNEVQVTQIDTEKIQVYDGWKDDLLIFEGNTLNEIARILERRYNVKIEIDNPELQNIKYSGSFKNISDVDKILNIIKQNTPISYKIEGQQITVTKTN